MRGAFPLTIQTTYTIETTQTLDRFGLFSRSREQFVLGRPDEPAVLLVVDLAVSFIARHDAFPDHVRDLPDIGVEPVALDMHVVRKGVQQAVGGVAVRILRGGPAQLPDLLDDRRLAVLLPRQGMNVVGQLLGVRDSAFRSGSRTPCRCPRSRAAASGSPAARS